jgi:hypothetical protein
MDTRLKHRQKCEGQSLYFLMVFVWGLLALTSMVIGGIAIVHNIESPTKTDFFGVHLSTGSVGIVALLFGLGFSYFTHRAVLRTQEKLAEISQQADALSKASKVTPLDARSNSVPRRQTAESPDCGYLILSRKIVSKYRTRTTGVLTHEVDIVATRDNVTQYQGRYRLRQNPPTVNFTCSRRGTPLLGEKDSGFQRFVVNFAHPLRNGESANIRTEIKWHEDIQEDCPEVMVRIFSPTQRLSFLVVLPEGWTALEPEGVIREHPGDHVPLTVKQLNSLDNFIEWNPEDVTPRHSYRISWKWRERASG